MKKETRSNKKLLWIIIILLFIILALTAWFEIPVTEHFKLESGGKITGHVRFALITDLHSCYYGKDQEKLKNMIDKEEVDAVLLSGDIFDDRFDDSNSKMIIEKLATEYPCYYVAGNHEFWSGRVQEMKEYLKTVGVTVLEGGNTELEVRGNTIDICGVDDPTYMSMDEWRKQLESAMTTSDNYKILLSHRPEKVDVYKDYNFDLVVAGHAHGGQWRIPFTKYGVEAPDQGLFPKYVDGLHALSDKTKMIVSRGLSRERIPLPRFFNHPEVVIIEID
ncbi:metallophosphoesterase [Butyrivibrio sp. AD3002]|uniref:metallophosphoesterase n=1 Tax=Butyrivibrio sp. AD3002 TaxID=1280670 RepID=UPI0003B7879D|nr:metallophosphoesterase [Butyrivibrio sp. AD3002]